MCIRRRFLPWEMLCPREPVFLRATCGGGSTIADTNCYYGACGITENAGTAGEKTEEEFRNGTVAGLLGEAFAQVGDYPKINGPADYSSVDAAIAKANALIKETSFSGGFAGEITDSTLTIQNCYVYQATLSTVGNAVPQGTGVFAGNLWGGQYDC